MASFLRATEWLLEGRWVQRAEWGAPIYVVNMTYRGKRVSAMFMKDGKFGPHSLGSYTPSDRDMRADDWGLVEIEVERADG